MWREFKEFALRGNVVDMAVGIIIGAAFGTIIKSLINDVIMPPVGLVLGGADSANFFLLLRPGTPGAPYASLSDAQAAGAVTINYGVFLNSVISFLVVVVVIFFLIRLMNRLRRDERQATTELTTRDCPFCLSAIPIKATRCGYCTSEVGEAS